MRSIKKRLRANSADFDSDYLQTKYSELIIKGRPGMYFFVMTLSSAVITTMGFIMNSPSVIIGAMVISPLLYPVILSGSAIAQSHWKETGNLLTLLVCGVILILTISSVLAFLIPFTYQSEVQSRLASSPLQYSIVALVSGIAGAFAYYWPKVSETITGVGISVALMPPVVMTGVALGNLDKLLLEKSIFIVVLNIFGIVLGSFVGYHGIKIYAANQ